MVKGEWGGALSGTPITDGGISGTEECFSCPSKCLLCLLCFCPNAAPLWGRQWDALRPSLSSLCLSAQVTLSYGVFEGKLNVIKLHGPFSPEEDSSRWVWRLKL